MQRLGPAAGAQALLDARAPLSGRPPPVLVAAAARGDAALHPPLLDLARAWPRAEMSRATLDAFHAAPPGSQREELAWLLKTVLAHEHAQEAVALVTDDAEDAQVRRWLLEGLERLASAELVGWAELEGAVHALAQERTATLREGLALLLGTLPWRPENEPVLAAHLTDPDPFVVATAVCTLAGQPDAVERLDPALVAALHRNPNPVVRQAVADMDKWLGQERRP